jgi:hypothetical protein
MGFLIYKKVNNSIRAGRKYLHIIYLVKVALRIYRVLKSQYQETKPPN